MLHEYEIAAYIEGSFPELYTKDDKAWQNNTGAFKAIKLLSCYLEKKSREHDSAAVTKIMRLAESIYTKGNATVKTGIENIFVYSINTIMPQESSARKKLQAIIPTHIFSIYVQQVLRSRN